MPSPLQLSAQVWAGRFDQSSSVQTTSLPSCLFSWRSVVGGGALQRGLWDGRAHSLGLIPRPARLLWEGGSQLGGFARLRAGMCCPAPPLPGLGTCEQPWGELAHPHLALAPVLGWGNLETEGVCSGWSFGWGSGGAFLAQCPAGLIPGPCSCSLCSGSAMAAPKRDFLQSRAPAKKSGAGSDIELAEDKPSRNCQEVWEIGECFFFPFSAICQG